MEDKEDKVKKPLASPKGDKIENRGIQQHALGIIEFVVIIVNLIFVPLRLRETYVTDGLYSRRFAHYAVCAFLLILIYARMHKMIGCRLFMVLMLPAMIGYLATNADLFVVCISVVVSIIFFSVLMIYDKNGDVKDNPLPVGATEETV